MPNGRLGNLNGRGAGASDQQRRCLHMVHGFTVETVMSKEQKHIILTE
jgi:hypothetical protein